MAKNHLFQRKTKIFVLRVACCQIEDLCHQEEEEDCFLADQGIENARDLLSHQRCRQQPRF